MKEFFDTTVLVAAMVEDEPRHGACAKALEKAEDGYASAHSVAECYATLTGGRLGLHLSQNEAVQLIRQDVYERLSLVAVSSADYMRVIETAGPAGARGGAICDLLLLACARKVGAERIYTLNLRHFTVLAPDLAARIVSP
ncbi:MAG: PIN domain-containing protein [Verrucomicrobiota bacterium]|nr:PIN domain-containing protein [Verrucomicrobiota bacterium]